MLQLILGLSGTGKTALLLAELKARSAAGKQSVLLVPEQFSSSAETMVYTALGDALSGFCEVYSFTSYAEFLLKTFGGTAVRTLTDAARAVAVRRALDTLGDEVPDYRRHRRSTGFCNLAAEAIKELKTAGAGPEQLLEIAARQGGDGAKLRELGLVYAAYEAVIQGSAMDPADRLTLAAQGMPEDFLADTAVYLDNFDGFTAPQYELLRKLLHAEQCSVALCCGELTDRDAGLGVFSPVKQTAQRLRRLAGREGVSVAVPRVMETDRRHENAPGLLAAAQVLAGEALEDAPCEGVWCTPAKDLYEECKRVACRIAALVRAGYAYGDIAVICRLLDDYAAPLRYEFGLADIPYFTDENDTLEHTAPAAFFRAALELLAKGIATEPLLRLLKTDLCGLSPEEVAVLENYAYTWQLSGKEWRQPFTKNPAGFGADWKEEDRRELVQAEALRGQVVSKLEHFRAAAKGKTAGGISRELYLLLQAFGGEEHTRAAAQRLKEAGDDARAAAVYRAWDGMMDLLGQMEQLLGKDEVSAAEYLDLLLLLIRSADVGHVPQTQDVVLLTTADRMRLSGPKVCFVLGLSEGHFPKTAGASGLLTHADRDLLVQSGVAMPGSYENRTLLEQMFFYRALTAPTQRLYLSYVAGGGAPAASALTPLLKALAPPEDVLTPAELAPTPAAALDLLGADYRADTPQNAALAAALAQSGGAAQSLAAMDRAARPRPFAAQDTAALKTLLGPSLNLSPTRLEQYYRCKFSYFLQYVLRIRPRRKAELSPLESGTLIHYILEQALRQAGEDFPSLSREAVTALAGEIADRYVAENMPAASARFGYLIERLKRGVTRLLLYLQAEQAQSSFHPIAFEQSIGLGEGALEPLTLTAPDGTTVRVVGQIDRVDVMRREGRDYLRVVDYKTGTKSFSLDEVYCGLNTQMLLYLFTICNNKSELYKNPVAAGVLYLAGDPPPKSATRATASDAPVYQVDGMVLNDPVVLRGMDKEATGLFVPCTFGKNGVPRASQKLATLEKLGNIQKHITGLVLQMARGLYQGEIAASPLRTAAHCPCDTCDYRPVCRHEDGVGEALVSAPKNVFETEEGDP